MLSSCAANKSVDFLELCFRMNYCNLTFSKINVSPRKCLRAPQAGHYTPVCWHCAWSGLGVRHLGKNLIPKAILTFLFIQTFHPWRLVSVGQRLLKLMTGLVFFSIFNHNDLDFGGTRTNPTVPTYSSFLSHKFGVSMSKDTQVIDRTKFFLTILATMTLPWWGPHQTQSRPFSIHKLSIQQVWRFYVKGCTSYW